jgi:hypothetical protein
MVARRRRARRGQQALGGVLDSIWGALGAPSNAITSAVRDYGQGKTQECLAAADQYTAQLDAKMYALAQQWNPNPAFVPADVLAILGSVSNVMVQAQTRLLTTPWNTGDATAVIAQAMGDLNKQIQDATRFTNAVAQAKATGSPYVNAPDIKDWVLQSMIATSQAYAVAFIETCDVTWLERVLQSVDDVLNSVPHYVGVAIEAAVNAAVAAGTAVVDVASGAFSIVSFLGKYGLYLALAGGGYYAYTKYKKK